MSQPFEITADVCGDYYARGGFVRDVDSAKVLTSIPADGSSICLGGSGLALRVSGMPAADADGVWPRVASSKWQNGNFRLEASGLGFQITDGTGTLATRASGGNLGPYASAAYGQALYGLASYTVTVAADGNAPGTLPTAVVTLSGGTAAAGDYAPSGENVWTHALDAAWTLVMLPDGAAEMRHATVVVARREVGRLDLPDGTYTATPAGQAAYQLAEPPTALSAAPVDVPDDDPAPVDAAPAPDMSEHTDEDDELVLYPTGANPEPVPEPEEPAAVEAAWGTLTLSLTYPTPGSGGVAVASKFLGVTTGVDATHPTTAGYTTWTTAAAAGQTTHRAVIRLDLAAAAAAITEGTEMELHADGWGMAEPLAAPATLVASYELNGQVEESWTEIVPGTAGSTAASIMQILRMAAYNPTPVWAAVPWTAAVTCRQNPLAAGDFFIVLSGETGSVVCGPPQYAALIPEDTPQIYHIKVAECDGVLRQLHTGPLFWRELGSVFAAPAGSTINEDESSYEMNEDGTTYPVTEDL